MSTASSGEQALQPDVSDSPSHANKKRSSRACDQCRRTKSKCRKPVDPSKPCSNCVIAGLTCTFQGPSYKRGPPKGYISAIEQRLHQVEAVLGAIINANDPRSQEVISALKTDDIAKEIIDRVDHGPYGSVARTGSPAPADFSATIRQLNESRDSRAARESRVNRESLSTSHHDIPAPTPEWLRRLDDILEGRGQSRYPGSSSAASSFGSGPSETIVHSTSVVHIPEKEEDRLEKVEDEEAIGSLSVNENDEIRYHNESSGMSLLDKLADNSSGRNSGGIWRLPMARIWPYAPMHLAGIGLPLENIPIHWPSREHADLLIQLYFTYVHPDLPVLHKPTFMALYQSQFDNDADNPPTHASSHMQTRLAQLILLSIFTLSSRFNEKEMPLPEAGRMWEAGCNYLASARGVLYTVLHTASLLSCQALVILAYRELGLGSFEHSSSFMSMAIHMAQELGLHRSAERWQRFGVDIFSSDQKQERKHVWWSCAIAEKYLSCALGKPAVIRSSDYDTELPDDRNMDPQSPFREEVEVWQPHRAVIQSSPQPPVLCHTLSTFRAAASLSVITGRIIDKIYAIRQKPWPKKHRLLIELDKQLNDWLSGLPAHLHYDLTTRRPVPPQTLFLHIQHSVAVILLHRRFIPRVNHQESAASAHGIDTSKEFAQCQAAAEKITALAWIIREVFSLKAVSAYLPSYLMSAGIVHLAALAMNRGDRVRSVSALRNTLVCLRDMERVWPSSARNYELLGSALSKFEADLQSNMNDPDQFGLGSHFQGYTAAENARVMAQLLGLEIPGVNPTVHQPPWASGSVPNSSSSSQTGFSPASADYTRPGTVPPSNAPAPGQWMQEFPDSSIPFQGYDFQSFTNSDMYY
ncbi:uncharacterized protein FOMMEDRAFT_19176, partial [Fomitiporia mediterranea MF3/22]|uniref:uncharacterized protein n=1 Tax=Fomitiporia mediterranea (strain MF3/22) TaxID=694068 RepID=UPI0004407C42